MLQLELLLFAYELSCLSNVLSIQEIWRSIFRKITTAALAAAAFAALAASEGLRFSEFVGGG